MLKTLAVPFIGDSRTLAITAPTVVKPMAGRTYGITFTNKGTTPTKIHDSNVLTGLVDANCLGAFDAPTDMSLTFTKGIVVVPGTGAVVNIFWN